jgi:tRNA pseudouridine55 synthase
MKNSVPEGILIIDKCAARPAFSLVSKLRKLSGVRRIGHAGTLDPFATGVMVMLIGSRYTRMSDQFLKDDKEYIATIYLGKETDSYDCDGNIVSENGRKPTIEEIEKTLASFQGEVWQTPPMFSAKKVAGKKLYELARKGQIIERKPSLVRMDTSLISYEYPHVKICVRCSKGTYIRSIAHDLGDSLGIGAHLSSLKRTKSGRFTIEQAIPQSSLDTIEWQNHLIRL